MTIGEKIFTIMQENNLTQKQFAEKIGASQASVNYWVNGDREPKLAHLRKIADTFNINISELLGLPLKMESINTNDSIIIDGEPENTVKNPVIESDPEFVHAWDNFLLTNNIHFTSWEKDGVPGMLLLFTDTREAYFLTREQAKRLPELSVEQVKLLIKAMGKENFSNNED